MGKKTGGVGSRANRTLCIENDEARKNRLTAVKKKAHMRHRGIEKGVRGKRALARGAYYSKGGRPSCFSPGGVPRGKKIGC